MDLKLDTETILIDLIQNNPEDPLIGYNELIDKLNDAGHALVFLDEDNVWANHPLRDVFEQLDFDDAKTNRAFRTAIVVRKGGREGNTTPGFGFWEARERLRGIKVKDSSVARMTAWVKDLNELLIYWKDR